jgi:hypothetical protein
MSDALDLFGEVEPRGSAQCPSCGRFSPIVDGSRPLGIPEDAYAVVECKQHGRGVA